MCPDDNVIQYSYPIYPIYRFKMNRTDDVQSSTKVKRRKTILETNRKRTQPSRGMLNARERTVSRSPCGHYSNTRKRLEAHCSRWSTGQHGLPLGYPGYHRKSHQRGQGRGRGNEVGGFHRWKEGDTERRAFLLVANTV